MSTLQVSKELSLECKGINILRCMKLSINSRIIKQNYRICSYCTTTQSQATFADPLGYKCQMKISSVRLLLRKEMGGNLQVPNGKILFLLCYCNEGGGQFKLNFQWGKRNYFNYVISS